MVREKSPVPGAGLPAGGPPPPAASPVDYGLAVGDGDAVGAGDLMADGDENQRPRAPLLLGDIFDHRAARRLFADADGPGEGHVRRGPHAPGQGHRGQEAAAPGVAVGIELGGLGQGQEIEPVIKRRQRVAGAWQGFAAVQGRVQRRHRPRRDQFGHGLGTADPSFKFRAAVVTPRHARVSLEFHATVPPMGWSGNTGRTGFWVDARALYGDQKPGRVPPGPYGVGWGPVRRRDRARFSVRFRPKPLGAKFIRG